MSKRIITIDGVPYIRADAVRPEDMERDEFAQTVIEAVAHVSMVRATEITGRSRNTRLSAVRAAAISIMRDFGSMPWESIGDAMNRNHSTVLVCMDKHGNSRAARRICKLAIERMGATG